MKDRPQTNTPTEMLADLVQQIDRDNCVLLLVPELGSEDGFVWHKNSLPSATIPPVRPPVARYYQAMTNRQCLILRLREWLDHRVLFNRNMAAIAFRFSETRSSAGSEKTEHRACHVPVSNRKTEHEREAC